jgi:hypothetical protein
LNHHCKKGKVCEIDEENNSPMCVCQDPSSCPAAAGEFEHVSLIPGLSGQTVQMKRCVARLYSFFALYMPPYFLQKKVQTSITKFLVEQWENQHHLCARDYSPPYFYIFRPLI